MILMALSMLDVFHIQAPKFLRNSGGDSKLIKKGYLGVLLLGMVSGLVVAPCTAPPLGVLLTYVATTGNVVRGAGLLFVFSMGMGALLLLVGTFSGVMSTLPRSGNWMIWIKKGMAFLIILVGEYFIFSAGKVWI